MYEEIYSFLSELLVFKNGCFIFCDGFVPISLIDVLSVLMHELPFKIFSACGLFLFFFSLLFHSDS